MSVHTFGTPAAPVRQKREIRVTQDVPAFRADDAVLEKIWRTVEEKCAEAGKPRASLVVYQTVRVSGRSSKERHEHEYESVDHLRRSASAPDLLREYSLNVSSPWGDDYRRVRFAAGRSGLASIEASAPDGEWCREVVDAVLDLLRPHHRAYAFTFRGGWIATLTALILLTAGMLVALIDEPNWTPWAVCLTLILLILARDWLLPTADIRVDKHRARVAQPEWPTAAGGSRDEPSAP